MEYNKRFKGESRNALYSRIRQRTQKDMMELTEQAASIHNNTHRSIQASTSSVVTTYNRDPQQSGLVSDYLQENHAASNVFSPTPKQSAEKQTDTNSDLVHLSTFDNPLCDEDYNYWSLSESDTDSDTDLDITEGSDSIELKLKTWGNQFSITHSALNNLLVILRLYFLTLPKDATTLLGTKKTYQISKCGNGEYFHYGIETAVEHILKDSNSENLEQVQLQFNVDGLPLHKSSNSQFWPILCQLAIPLISGPFVVGLYSGPTKPPVTFLNDFVSELKRLQTHGISVQSNKVKVNILNFVCDAPARAFIKCVKSHSGYSSCEKCSQRGEWEGKVIFPEVDCPLRTDDQFDRKEDEDHHLPNTSSPLENLAIGMVSQFPLDPMHLLYLGVTRRLLMAWLKGPLSVRLPAATVTNVSNFLLQLGQHIPSEFARKPRALSEIDRWKATEFRLFLCYVGPVTVSKFVKDDIYKHFMLLFTAITILSRRDLCSSLNSYAAKLLTIFVKGVEELYSRGDLVYNIHGLVHLAGDVEHYGPLETFSSFKFENKLKSIKKLVRKPQYPLQQVIRRLSEQNQQNLTDLKPKDRSNCKLSHQHCQGPTLPHCQGTQYRGLQLNNMVVKVGKRDGCVMLRNQTIAIVQNIVSTPEGDFLLYTKFETSSDYFNYPVPSSKLNIYRLSHHQNTPLYIAKPGDIFCKYMLLPVEMDQPNEYAGFPLLHN